MRLIVVLVGKIVTAVFYPEKNDRAGNSACMLGVGVGK